MSADDGSDPAPTRLDSHSDGRTEGPAECLGGAERRADPRAPIELKVAYQKLNTFFADYTRNICKGGTFIRTRKPLAVGTEFLFQLSVPQLDEPLTIRGEVRWIKREGEASPDGTAPAEEPGMGIRFLYDTPEQRAFVERTVERLLVENLGAHVYAKLLGREPR